MVLHIFNPETDYALAGDRSQYTPPRKVMELRQKLAALPAVWANPGDVILMTDTPVDSPYLKLAAQLGISMVQCGNLSSVARRLTGVAPWGWNRALANMLAKHGVDRMLLPSDFETLRRLSHRRNTIAFHPEGSAPCELKTEREVCEWLRLHPDSYLKAPWSSSGRGVICTSSMTAKSITGWSNGIIGRQGSVMAEVACARALDFATEWECHDGEVTFCGFSVFRTSPEGRYAGNLSCSQDELRECISRHADWDDGILDTQRQRIQDIFAPYYNGPLGIDMLADTHRRINICVEVNLRRTMGMAAAALYRLTGHSCLWNPLDMNPVMMD